MFLNIDKLIFLFFLVVIMITGLFYGRKIYSTKEYALGGRNFSTSTIVTTLIATWISSRFFLHDFYHIYPENILFTLSGIFGDLLSWLVICYIIAPRMGEFLGSLSIADSMGKIYGNKVRFLIAIISSTTCICKIAIQFKLSAIILQLFFENSSFYTALASSIVIITYSSLGGIKATTFTDVIQLKIAIFWVIIPIIIFFIWHSSLESQIAFFQFSEKSIFDYQQFVNSDYSQLWVSFTIFLYFIIPTFSPATFQKITIAKNTLQVADSFFFASFTRLLISITFLGILFLFLASKPDLEFTSNIISYVIDNDLYIGLKGIIACGIIAMIMSNTDSYLNAATIIFSYDLRKSLGLKALKRNLIFTYFCAFSIGIFALVMAFQITDIWQLILLVNSFYIPLVTTPFLLTVFGFRSNYKSIIAGMIISFITIIIGHLQNDSILDIILYGILVNLVMIVLIHYLLNMTKGFVGVKDNRHLQYLKNYRQRRFIFFKQLISNFNFLNFCQANSPKDEVTYTIFGVFSSCFIIITIYTIPLNIKNEYLTIHKILYDLVFILSGIFLTYQMWLPGLKNKNFIAILWLFGLFYSLVFISCLQVIISDCDQLTTIIFIINLTLVAILAHWQLAIFIIITGVICSIEFYKFFVCNHLQQQCTININIIYIITLIIAIIISFLRPKQRQLIIANLARKFLNEKIQHRNEELQKLYELKNELIRNLNHEIHTPVTGIVSLGHSLLVSYDILTEQQRLSVIKDIAVSSDRLESLVNNLLDLSKLTSLSYILNIEKINLAKLIYERINIIKKLYPEKGRKPIFLIDVTPVYIYGDHYYIRQAIDNILSNAIIYGKGKPISITLEYSEDTALITIYDQGIGIPKNEIYDIFGVFNVSSRTKTPAGGRGVGLALCKKVVEVHGGKIKVENNLDGGATFSIALPLRHF
ncbi:MAG: alkaline phosphatase [Rickettsiaceae bacterium]|nr:alkaline phosphatase [Rickettsiaceae bacterium]